MHTVRLGCKGHGNYEQHEPSEKQQPLSASPAARKTMKYSSSRHHGPNPPNPMILLWILFSLQANVFLEAALKQWQELKYYQQNPISLTVSILGLSRCCIKFQSFSHILNWFLVSVAWATRIQATRLPSGSSSKSPLAWIMNIYQVFSVKNWHHDIDWLSGEHSVYHGLLLIMSPYKKSCVLE